MQNLGLDKSQAGIKIAGRNINNLRYADDTTLMAESEEELKSLLLKVIKESEKSGLKFNIQKTKIMAFCPITFIANRWGNNGNSERLYFLGLQNYCRRWLPYSHGIKRGLLLGRKAMTNLDSLLKSRDITLSTKVHLGQSYSFSSSQGWMWELDCKESWVVKNWCFWTVVLEKTFECPLDSKEIQPVHPKGN